MRLACALADQIPIPQPLSLHPQDESGHLVDGIKGAQVVSPGELGHIPRQMLLAPPVVNAYINPKLLPRLAKRVNVYFNNRDMAMAVSDKTKGNPDRLGDDGPRIPRGVPGKVSLIDCTDVVDGLVEHSYFLDTPSGAAVRSPRLLLGRDQTVADPAAVLALNLRTTSTPTEQKRSGLVSE